MPIAFAPIGVEMTIMKVVGGDAVIKRMVALGIKPGSKVTVFSSGKNGIIAYVLGAKIALDGDLSTRIYVA